ncbi:SAM-dependent methyltransferase [Actinoplanes lutulentus]|uniref:S-adenosyl methyltransferase n=1 Tax=Actinoplanes lutulentus TaxID=1287878 RepID=A0A327Z4V9_9ACTN|nr:SAM-dependent methyltransferase [Actinoplanes lutulentus]MBB2949029.1 SAM-dependent methyltransferase [Actinoplanes lutulentus]RAK31353.1 S-adenosyl methyltransferase [Actinoplanes lutulentus]
MTETTDWVPAGIDVNRPSAARVYDYFLGGAHNFAVDRALAEQIASMTPNIGETMRSNRVFLRRAVRFLAGQGVRQFLDIGSGIPTAGNVHEIALEAAPGSTVVYVDIDPVAVEHSRAILSGVGGTGVICADVRDADRIIAESEKLGLIDFTEPVAVLLAGVLHFVPDSDDPGAAVAALRDALVPGSFLLISHATGDGQPPEVIEAQRLSSRTGTEIALRTGEQVTAYFSGFDLVEPGLVFIPQWRPDAQDPVDEHPERVGAYAGVARKG